jgi:hypothetical protein
MNDKRKNKRAANNNALNPSDMLLEWQGLCRRCPMTVKDFQQALGQTGRSAYVTASRYCKQGYLTRINPGVKPALYGHPPATEGSFTPESRPRFEKHPPKLPKPHPLIEAWSPPRMATGRLQGVWG